MLTDLVDNSRTDKNTLHSYLPLYESLLKSRKDSAKNVLEIGISFGGGSIKLWHDYFPNATVHGLDIMNLNDVWDGIKNNDRIHLTSVDAYSDSFIDTLEKSQTRFDFMLDDGPHTLESMQQYVKRYSQLLTEDGILILEDIQNWDWIDSIKQAIPADLHQYVKTYDLREQKGRYDDIVLTIDRRG